MEIVQKEGNREIRRSIDFDKLDMIISVGYRVNSKRATQFRIWAANILRQHMLRGYTLNETRLFEAQTRFKELQNAIELIQSKVSKKELALFVYFLDKNRALHKKTGEPKINDNALPALAFLIAASDPKEKDILIKIILNLLAD